MNNKQVALYITVVISVIIGILVCVGVIIENQNFSFENFNIKFLEDDEDHEYDTGNEYYEDDEDHEYDTGNQYYEDVEIKTVELNFDNYIEEYSSIEDTNVFTEPMNLSNNDIEEVVEGKDLYPIQNENGLYQYIDTNGTYVSDNQYEFAQPFSEGIAIVYEEGIVKFIDENFQEVIENNDEYFYASDFKNGLSICSNSSYSEVVINKYGQQILKADTIMFYSNGLLELNNNGKETYYNYDGVYLPILEKYEFYGDEKAKFIQAVDKDYNIICIDREGFRIDIVDGVWSIEFNNKISNVWIEDKSEYININEEFEIIPFKQGYVYLHGDNNQNMHCLFDYYATNDDEEYVYIDNEGDILFRSEFDSYDGFIDGITITSNNRHYSLVDLKNNKVSKKEYDYIEILENKYFKVKCDDKYGIVNSNDEIIIPIEYKNIDVVGGFIVCQKSLRDNVAEIYNEDIKLIGQSYY